MRSESRRYKGITLHFSPPKRQRRKRKPPSQKQNKGPTVMKSITSVILPSYAQNQNLNLELTRIKKNNPHQKTHTHTHQDQSNNNNKKKYKWTRYVLEGNCSKAWLFLVLSGTGGDQSPDQNEN